MTPKQLAQIRRFWGLDRPLPVQYLTWVGNLLRGDFGESIGSGGQPVGELLRDAAPNTLQLNVLALLVSVGVAIPVGLVAALLRCSRQVDELSAAWQWSHSRVWRRWPARVCPSVPSK